jgi:hypothetical protein
MSKHVPIKLNIKLEFSNNLNHLEKFKLN